ncbi:hypothetical protein B0I35DRAFT_425746 [Stachybotrys elegans]|uniref:Cupin type-2 domain-containing protein n=1 Tax=Stachybotrys elegans TaxID=80388 RepID=A0A8K0ST06_9HYPO|nr:hypothetical protein B0I35DRAFT_425746 [Stachybotrys elegans]
MNHLSTRMSSDSSYVASPSVAMPSATSSPRLVVSTHDTTGASLFASDGAVPLFQPLGSSATSFSVFDVRDTVPVNNLDAAHAYPNMIPRCPPNGVIFCLSNIPPKFTVPMHRTLSLDYGVILSGEIDIRLDSGDERTLKAGDFIIQGGVNHQWINKTDDFCRIAFVTVGAKKIELSDGSELEAIEPKRPS